MTRSSEDHPLRRALNDEAHARPPEALVAPVRLSFLALEDDGLDRSVHEAAIRDLCRRFGVEPPPAGANHFSRDLGPFRVKWEKHTEFTRYKLIVAAGETPPFEARAVDLLPADWLAAVPGKRIAAAHVELIGPGSEPVDPEAMSGRWFFGHALVGGSIADGAALAFTDFRIREDGFTRFAILDRSMAPRQAGRTVQRLLEIDAYRILAMMALPVARDLGPELSRTERELVDVTAALATGTTKDEPELLDRLTRIEAQIQQRLFQSAPRFSASEAYYRLIQRRTEELRERRIDGVQTFREFIERRLSPAMSTCVVSAARLEKLSQRVSETTGLLSTRVEVLRQRQAQAELESLNRRALLQLRMQETVEGLSVAAITYYVVGLISYLAKGLYSAGVPVRSDVIVAVSVPIVAVVVGMGVRRIRTLVAPPIGRHD